MTGLTLTLRDVPRQRVDLSALTPDRLKGLDGPDVSKLSLNLGNTRISLGDLFAVRAGDPQDLLIEGSCARFDGIGRCMSGGLITVQGDAGAYLGENMTGGRIVLQGNAGIGAAMGMRGGLIEIGGNAGDLLGSARPGDMKGMSGGTVVVRGDVGQRVGDRMRRGTIVVEGNAAGYAASRMIAGTIIILGANVGSYPGFGMKRGTFLMRRRAERELPSFGDCGRHELGFLRVLFQALRGHSRRLDQLGPQATSVRRLAGDQSVDGKGEILVLED